MRFIDKTYCKLSVSSGCVNAPVEMSTAPRPRSTRCGFWKFCRLPAAPRDF